MEPFAAVEDIRPGAGASLVNLPVDPLLHQQPEEIHRGRIVGTAAHLIPASAGCP
jgi:hypothetical protein